MTETAAAVETEEAGAPDETREDRFVRLARARVRKAVKAIQLVGNLGDKSSYASTPEQVDKIRKELERQVDKTVERLGGHQEGLFDL